MCSARNGAMHVHTIHVRLVCILRTPGCSGSRDGVAGRNRSVYGPRMVAAIFGPTGSYPLSSTFGGARGSVHAWRGGANGARSSVSAWRGGALPSPPNGRITRQFRADPRLPPGRGVIGSIGALSLTIRDGRATHNGAARPAYHPVSCGRARDDRSGDGAPPRPRGNRVPRPVNTGTEARVPMAAVGEKGVQ